MGQQIYCYHKPWPVTVLLRTGKGEIPTDLSVNVSEDIQIQFKTVL